MPPGAAKRDLAETRLSQGAIVKGGQAKRAQCPRCHLKRATGKKTFSKKRIFNLYMVPDAILIMPLITKNMIKGNVL